MVEYGLIGKRIDHSLSAEYFNTKFKKEGRKARYSLYNMDTIFQLRDLLDQRPNIKGLNVTSPYKRAIISYMDELSTEAELLNAVNVIEFKSNGKLKGHNTDWEGFRDTLQQEYGDKKALILGTGGAASAVEMALHTLGFATSMVSRNPVSDQLSYQEANKIISDCALIVNATPLGMAPNDNEIPPLDMKQIDSKHVVYDLIYNPPVTRFLELAAARGARIVNGLQMLHNQAELSWRIWNAE